MSALTQDTRTKATSVGQFALRRRAILGGGGGWRSLFVGGVLSPPALPFGL